MTPKNPEISRPLTERLTELTSDLRRTQELAKGGLLPLERRSLAMLEELGLLHCRKEEAAMLPQEQAAFEAFGAAWERLRSVEEAVRAGDGPSSTHASAIQEMQVQARELKVVLNAPALARAEAAEAEVMRLREGMWLIVYVNTDLTDDSPHPEIMEFGGRWNPDAVQEMLDTIKEDVPRDLQRDVFYRLPVSRETSDAYGSEGMPYHTPEWDDRERVEFCNVCHALLTTEQAYKVPMDEPGGVAIMCATHALAGSPS